MMIMLLTFSFILLMAIFSLFKEDKKLADIQNTLKNMSEAWTKLQEEHQALLNADLFFSKELQICVQQIKGMDNQLQELANSRANDGGYQHALHILDLGGSREEIMDSCHVSAAEADLLMNMHAYKVAMHESVV